MKLNNKFWFLSLFFILPHAAFGVKDEILSSDLVVTLKNSDIVENSIIIDNPYFKSYIMRLVEDVLEDKNAGQLSDSLLRCYELVCKDEKEFLVQDIIQSFPELVAGLKQLETKAPRPQSQHQIVGPTTCDLSEIVGLLNYLYTLLIQCCNASTVSFSGTFTAFYDLQGTLTQCCANTTSEFDSTFTVIDAIQNKLITCCIDFNNAFIGTFTVIEYGINTLFPRLVTNLTTVEGLLNSNIDLVTVIGGQFFNCCLQLQGILTNCCNQLITTSSAILSASNTILGDSNYAQELANYSNCQVNHFFPVTTC